MAKSSSAKYEIDEQVRFAAMVADELEETTLLDLLDALASAGVALVDMEQFAELSDNIASEAYFNVLNEGEIE